MFTTSSSFRALTILKHTHHTFSRTTMAAAASPPPTTLSIDSSKPITISLKEWQAWGTDSPMPTQVAQIVDEMMAFEQESDAQMKFGGIGGKLKV